MRIKIEEGDFSRLFLELLPKPYKPLGDSCGEFVGYIVEDNKESYYDRLLPIVDNRNDREAVAISITMNYVVNSEGYFAICSKPLPGIFSKNKFVVK